MSFFWNAKLIVSGLRFYHLIRHTSPSQPLDVSVFSSLLKTQYRQFRDDVALVSNADTISKEDFFDMPSSCKDSSIFHTKYSVGMEAIGLIMACRYLHAAQ